MRVCPVWVFSLGSCLLLKAEIITQCVLRRMCVLKDAMVIRIGVSHDLNGEKKYLRLHCRLIYKKNSTSDPLELGEVAPETLTLLLISTKDSRGQ